MSNDPMHPAVPPERGEPRESHLVRPRRGERVTFPGWGPKLG